MQRETDAATSRILSPLSALLKKTIRVVDNGVGERPGDFTVELPQAQLSVISVQGGAFNDEERHIIQAIFDVIRHSEENVVRVGEMQERLARIERDHMDLMVKNRILSEVSARDALTGLYNRWYVLDKIEAEINRSLRHGSPMSLMMLDIDHFKHINDTYGHPAGDQVLQSVGKLLRESCRVYDVAGRYGGEEFCVLLPETRLGNTPVVAERIRQRLEMTELSVGGSSVAVTASIGVASIESSEAEPVLSPAALIDRADRALYSAKNRGRNRVELWDSGLSEARFVEPTGH